MSASICAKKGLSNRNARVNGLSVSSYGCSCISVNETLSQKLHFPSLVFLFLALQSLFLVIQF